MAVGSNELHIKLTTQAGRSHNNTCYRKSRNRVSFRDSIVTHQGLEFSLFLPSVDLKFVKSFKRTSFFSSLQGWLHPKACSLCRYGWLQVVPAPHPRSCLSSEGGFSQATSNTEEAPFSDVLGQSLQHLALVQNGLCLPSPELNYCQERWDFCDCLGDSLAGMEWILEN